MDDTRPRRLSSDTTIILSDRENLSLLEHFFKFLSMLLIFICPLFIIFCIRVVKQYKRAVILRCGHVTSSSPAGPGVVFYLPCIDTVTMIDLRTRSFKLPPQDILTKDSVTVTVGAVIYFHVSDPINCLLQVESHQYSTEQLSLATLRYIVGRHTLSDLLTARDSISIGVRTEIDQTSKCWGVEVERVEMKDITLQQDVQRAMAAEAEGTRIGRAKIIEAEGEILAAESLREASRVLQANPQIMILRYLQCLNNIASGQNTIIFPLPMKLPDHRGNVS